MENIRKRLLVGFTLLSSLVFSQNYLAQRVITENQDEEIEDVYNNEEIELAAKEIVSKIGLPQNFVLQADPIYKNNATAKIITDQNGRKRRYVIYDPNFFTKINKKADNRWAAISILAHEIGHHLNNHSLNNDGSSYAYELEADKWSGFVLRKMGASLKDAQSAIATLKEQKSPSRTHPPKKERLLSIERGWRSGQEDLDKFTPEASITAERVYSKYSKAVGIAGSMKPNSIKYIEKMTLEPKTNEDVIGNDFVDVLYGYGEYNVIAIDSLGFLKTSTADGTSYLIKNHDYYFKKEKPKGKMSWQKGYHPYSEGIYFEFEELEVTPNIRPLIGDIYNEFSVDFSLDSVKFNTIKTVNNIPSYELTLGENQKKVKGKNKSLIISTQINKYYSIESGLLHFVEEVIEHKYLKKGRVTRRSMLISEITVEDYFLETEILMPHKFTVKKLVVKDGEPQMEVIQQRVISDVEINPIMDRSLFFVE
ncbi:hypothetical protein [Maribacter sp. R77961]|uniref:hypothetical protein n=1 Tax=Maribacter sp. R77961 TaxID=3093871 RepID=UPI0037C53B89